MGTYTVEAVQCRVYEEDEEGEWRPLPGWEEFDQAVRDALAEYPHPSLNVRWQEATGVIDENYGWLLLVADSEWGRRALARGGTPGLAVWGEGGFNHLGVWPDGAHGKMVTSVLEEAGVNPADWDINKPNHYPTVVFFPRRR
jgi:hypothetical protein